MSSACSGWLSQKKVDVLCVPMVLLRFVQDFFSLPAIRVKACARLGLRLFWGGVKDLFPFLQSVIDRTVYGILIGTANKGQYPECRYYCREPVHCTALF